MTKWTLEDYKVFYHERAGIQEEAFMNTKNMAEMQAYNTTIALFKEQENPSKDQLSEFHNFMKNKTGGQND